MSHGNLDFDYRRRCVFRRLTQTGMEYDVIRYGVRESEMNGSPWRDIRTDYAELGRGPRVRRPGNPVEVEYARQKHFFTKSLRHVGLGLQGGGDEDRIRARYAPRGTGGAPEVASGAEGAGGGDRGSEQEEMTS